ncbi:MAG: hypothetical protein RQ743_09200 [Bacteroidales bacterium]|nr:hypothetical protein [Bacteroidales bacterium]
MEDIGDILFYVLLAVFGIAGAIANKKKRNAQRPSPQSGIPASDDDSFSYEREEEAGPRSREGRASTQYEMIDEDALETAASRYENTMMKSSVEQALEMRAEYEGRYSEPLADDFSMEGVAVTDLTVEHTEVGTYIDTSLDEQSSWARGLVDDFDLPAAIVYSEILKRKDFV